MSGLTTEDQPFSTRVRAGADVPPGTAATDLGYVDRHTTGDDKPAACARARAHARGRLPLLPHPHSDNTDAGAGDTCRHTCGLRAMAGLGLGLGLGAAVGTAVHSSEHPLQVLVVSVQTRSMCAFQQSRS